MSSLLSCFSNRSSSSSSSPDDKLESPSFLSSVSLGLEVSAGESCGDIQVLSLLSTEFDSAVPSDLLEGELESFACWFNAVLLSSSLLLCLSLGAGPWVSACWASCSRKLLRILSSWSESGLPYFFFSYKAREFSRWRSMSAPWFLCWIKSFNSCW